MKLPNNLVFRIQYLVFRVFVVVLLLTSYFLLLTSNVWAATFSLVPASKDVSLNETFTVDVFLEATGENSSGADAIIKFDAPKIEGVSAYLGSLYTNKVTDNVLDNNLGQITLQATNPSGQYFSGSGTFATLTFKAIAGGTANVFFEFTSGSTTDTNVSYQGQDLLTSVANGSYTVSSAVATPSASPAVGGLASPSPSPTAPVSGAAGPTIFLLSLGSLFLIVPFLVKHLSFRT